MKNVNWSEQVTDQFVNYEIIKTEDKELYVYGLKQGLLLIGNILMTITIGFILGLIWESMVLIITYIPLRIYAGGYHARSQLICYIFSVAIMLLMLLLVNYIPWTNTLILWSCISFGIIIWILSPIGDNNKTLDKIEIITYKKRTKIILICETCILFFLQLLGEIQLSACIIVSFFTVSILQLTEIISNRRNLVLTRK